MPVKPAVQALRKERVRLQMELGRIEGALRILDDTPTRRNGRLEGVPDAVIGYLKRNGGAGANVPTIVQGVAKSLHTTDFDLVRKRVEVWLSGAKKKGVVAHDPKKKLWRPKG